MCGGGGILGSIGSLVSAPVKWAGDIMDWTGERTGIKPLEEAGNFIGDVQQNPTYQTLAGAGALAGAGYLAAPYAASAMGFNAAPYATPAMDTLAEGGAVYGNVAPGAAAGTLAPYSTGAAAGLTIPGAIGASEVTSPVAGYEQAAPVNSGAAANTINGQPLYGTAGAPGGYGAPSTPWYTTAMNSKWAIPAALMGANVLSQGIGAYTQANAMKDAQNNAMDLWRANAFPNSAAVNAQTNTMMSGLTEDELRMRRKVDEEAARRGLGAKSGLRSQAYTDLSKAGMQARAKALQDILKWQNTPYSAPPISTQVPTSWGERLASTIGDTTGLFGGMYLMDWMKNR